MFGTKTLSSVLSAAQKTITDLKEVAGLTNAKAASKEKQSAELTTAAQGHRREAATASIIADRMDEMLSVSDQDIATHVLGSDLKGPE